MALHIDAEIERLAREIAQLTGESETEAVRRLLTEQRENLIPKEREARNIDNQSQRIDEVMRWLREEVWPSLPADVRGKPIPKDEIDALYE